MTRAFTRQLGSQPGVQLNPLRDNTDGSVLGAFDQVAALVGRFRRGRIDRPFRVNRATFARALGAPESIAISTLNEAYTQGYEALQRGARELLVARLSVAAAAIKWASVTSGATSTFSALAAGASALSLATFNLKHMACHNDGIVVKYHADAVKVEGVDQPSKLVSVVVLDADGAELLRVKGSLDPAAKDESGRSYFIGDVSEAITDDFVFDVPAGAAVQPTHDAYGRDASGKDKWATSSTLVCFTEGGTGYSNTDYDRSVAQLLNATRDFGYIISGGSRAVALLSKLADLAFDTNRQFLLDVPGDLSPSAAITWLAQLGFGTKGRDHYPQAYWAPLKAGDPIAGGSAIFGTSGVQVGLRCARNAQTNAYGLAPKNFPIAGKDWALGRTSTRQIYTPSEQELSDLADAKINPVIYEAYNGGGKFVFSDSLTCAATKTSYRKLITVAEMSAHLDEMVVRYGRECLQLPMELAIKRMSTFLERIFGYALASGWLVEGGVAADGITPVAPFAFNVRRNALQPADRMDVEYWLHYDGVARQIHVTQTIV